MTVAEPEMEVDGQGSDPEPENPDDLSDLEELPGETNDNSDDTRQAVLLSGVTPVLEPRLEIARAAMQPTAYLDTRAGNCVDANRIAFAYAAYFVCRTIYKMWPGAIKWMTLPFDKMVERFNTGKTVTMQWERGQDLYLKLTPRPTSAGISQTKKFGTAMLQQVERSRTQTSTG